MKYFQISREVTKRYYKDFCIHFCPDFPNIKFTTSAFSFSLHTHVCTMYIHTFFLDTLKESCRHDNSLPLMTSNVFPQNKDILLHKYYTTINRKLTHTFLSIAVTKI